MCIKALEAARQIPDRFFAVLGVIILSAFSVLDASSPCFKSPSSLLSVHSMSLFSCFFLFVGFLACTCFAPEPRGAARVGAHPPAAARGDARWLRSSARVRAALYKAIWDRTPWVLFNEKPPATRPSRPTFFFSSAAQSSIPVKQKTRPNRLDCTARVCATEGRRMAGGLGLEDLSERERQEKDVAPLKNSLI